ncbi:MAG: TIGR01459 family HAD-type hydrolase [Cohaesibacter sp.]|nr:TIGR01459 family HAD-type hydrolase [Cohaesibacter sp.]
MSSRLPGLSVIASNYQGLLSDIWGVIHNGVAHNKETVEALANFRKQHGPVILITNAPRPNGPILKQLDLLGVPKDCYDAVVTSGDVSRDAILQTGKTKLYHLGPDRDLPLYEGLNVELVDEKAAELVCCTGLLDDAVETPDDYDAMLKDFAKRGLQFICANPDRVVEKGGTLIYCAGALAERFEAYGGEPIMVGKPCGPIYDASLAELTKANGGEVERDKILLIGDSLPTDMRGAHHQKLDALFITAGIHAADFGPSDDPDAERVLHRLDHEDVQAVGFMPRLSW